MMIQLHDICYLRLGCKDLDEMADFSTRILGLEVWYQDEMQLLVRADDSTHNICYVLGSPDYEVAAFEMRDSIQLRAAIAELEICGVEVTIGTQEEAAKRRVDELVRFRDPSNNEIELVVRPHRTGKRYVPSRDAGITEFGHFALHSNKPVETLSFWTEIMGARISDIIGAGALLRIDQVHHKIALFPSSRSGIQHINFQVESIDDVMKSWYFLQGEGVPIAFGPGRHPTSTAIFLYFVGPDNRVYEYSHGVKRILDEESYVPRRFESSAWSFCMWGSRPSLEEFS